MIDHTDRSTEALLIRRTLAEKATPGPWRQPGRFIGDMKTVADAAHIAASPPDVVMADIDEILRLREENEKLASVLKIQLQEAAVELLNGAMRQYTEGDGEVFSLGVSCPHCDMHFSTVDEAVAHDAVCLKHPASIRAERIEKEANWLATAAANNGWHGVGVSPEQMREAARKAMEEACPKN